MTSDRAGADDGGVAPERLHAVDALRALAFLAVFAFHTWEFAGRPEVPVVSAVVGANVRPDFFVVLTGFVLFLPLARDRGRLPTFRTGPYLVRRLRRIVPPYYVALAFAVLLPQALVVLVRAAGLDASWQDLPSTGDVATHLTFTHLFFPEHWDTVNGSLWTMALEMQLYLLFPLLVLGVVRFGPWVLAAVAGVSIAYGTVVGLVTADEAWTTQFLWKASAPGRAVELVAGMAAAWVAFSSPLRGRLRALLGVLGVVGAAVALGGLPGPVPWREVGLAAAFGALVLVIVTAPPAARALGALPLAALGVRAYSLFLVHQPVAWFASEGLRKGLGLDDGALLLLALWSAGLVAVLAVGQVLYVVVERPSIAWARRTPRTLPRIRTVASS